MLFILLGRKFFIRIIIIIILDMFVLTESSGFAFALHQSQDISFPNWTLNIADNAASWIGEELNANLGDSSTRSRTSDAFNDSCKGNWFILLNTERK